MRIAIISDIHANATALSAVLSDININKIDSVICLGDVVTLGPSPKEVLDKIRDMNIPCILGNHEEALFDPEMASDYDIKGNLLQQTLYWCIDKLQANDMMFLKSFVDSLSVELADSQTMLCYHGSPHSSIESIYSNTLDEQLEKFFNQNQKIKIAVGGHTHIQMFRQYQDMLIVNPGSVGCAFRIPFHIPPTPSILPVAEYAIIDSNEDGNISVELKQVPFDIVEFISILEKSDLPLKTWWIDEYKRLGY